MDKMTHYRELLRRLLKAHVEFVNRGSPSGVRSKLVADDENGHYLWLNYGWENGRRARSIVVYAHLENGKIWIEEDWTEEGIATELVREGVPKEDIVLAWHSPEMRPYTDFAAA